MNNGLFKRQYLKETSLVKTTFACSPVACSPVVCSPVAGSEVACAPVACSSNRLLVRQLPQGPDASSAVTCSSVVCSDSFTSCRFRCSSGLCVVAIHLCPSQRTLRVGASQPREESPESDTGASQPHSWNLCTNLRFDSWCRVASS